MGNNGAGGVVRERGGGTGRQCVEEYIVDGMKKESTDG